MTIVPNFNPNPRSVIGLIVQGFRVISHEKLSHVIDIIMVELSANVAIMSQLGFRWLLPRYGVCSPKWGVTGNL